MVHLDNWLFGLALVVALVVFLYSVFDLSRRLMARFAVRVCRMRAEREGSFICELKHKLHRFASKSLVPQIVMLVVSLAALAFIMVEHSSKL
ncbi:MULTISPECIES: hypothetical protein [Thiorhodovibrio]|uniref:hypothetical protein n=1 Tax=Thiorhodovibrio TaxID=61593 RepID=UPI001911F195|nr:MULTISPECIES: hypothetical protein [Thiorhodovibrio]WPL13174.1 hypothetical protein Thiosp_02968 [Thiorhodovibrio litoralis]